MEARETFESARAAAARIEELRRLVEEARPPRGRSGGPCGTHGDPTASLAEYAVEMVPAMVRELKSCEAAVGEALALVEGVRRTIETPWWRVLELYYIDRLGWCDVAEEMGLSVRTCHRWRDAACDWLDFIGEANARSGRGRASW